MTVRFGKDLQRRSLVLCFVIALLSLVGRAHGESVVVVQGYQAAQSEKYAANTTDAYLKAFRTQGGTVKALRPQSQPGWEGGDAYADGSGLLAALAAAAAGQDLLVVLVGDAHDDGGLLVAEGASVSAAGLADAVSTASRVSIVSAGCNSLALSVDRRLSNVQVVVSGTAAGQGALTWPKGDRGQYDLFSRYLLEGYYLLATQQAGASVGDLVGRAFPLARKRMTQTSGGRQVPDGRTASGGPATADATVKLSGGEYNVTLQGAGGFVSNALGLPIAPVRDAKVSAGQTAFTFEERGRSRSVTVSDTESGPAVTLDGRSVAFVYRPDRVELLSAGQAVGTTYVTRTIGGSADIETVSTRRASRATVRADGSASFTLSGDGGSIDVNLNLRPLGDIDVQVAGADRYNALDVVRYGLYAEGGDRVATLVGVLSGAQVVGQVRPDAGQMRLSLSADLENDGLSGAAELVGTRYALSSGWAWSTNRPPTRGAVQSDYLDLPAVSNAYADAGAGDGSVSVTWDVDDSRVSNATLLGDLRFEVLRTDAGSGKSETFPVPAGRRQYADRPSGDPAGYDYAVRPVLDHRVVSCDGATPYPLRGDAVAAKAGKPQPKVAPRVAMAPKAPPASQAVTPSPEPEKAEPAKEKKEEKKKEEKEDEAFPWDAEKKEGIGGKIVYGIFGALIILAIGLAIGGGGGDGLPPGDAGGVIDQ